MSIHRSHGAHYEEYREFFSLLASGDPTQYSRAQKLFPPPHMSTSSLLRTRPMRVEIDTLSDSADESDDSSTTLVDIESIGDCKNQTKTVEVVVEEVTSVAMIKAPLPTPEDSPRAPPVASVPSFAYQPCATKPESPLMDLESSASAVTTSNEEFRTKLKQLLRGLYDIETFRGLVREVLRDSEQTFRPLTEIEARRAQSPAVDTKRENNKGNGSPIFKGFDDEKAKHATKKRCVVQPSKIGGVESGSSDGKAGFKSAQHLMDMLSDLMTPYKGNVNPHWKKLKMNLSGGPKSWPKPKSSKKRVFTDLEE